MSNRMSSFTTLIAALAVLASIGMVSYCIVYWWQSSTVEEGIITKKHFIPSRVKFENVSGNNNHSIAMPVTYPEEWWIGITGLNSSGKERTRWLQVSKDCYVETAVGQNIKASELW